MKTGIIISGIIHGIILLLILLRLEGSSHPVTEIIEVTEVTLITADELEPVVSDAPQVMDMQMTVMAQPVVELNDATRPNDAIAPEETDMDITEDPTDRDTDPDLTALERLAQPKVAVVAAQPSAPMVLPQMSPSVSFGGGVGNSSAPSFSSPAMARSTPRIASFSAPALPDTARISDRSRETAAPDETVTEVVEEANAEALPKSATEITPDTQSDAESSSPPLPTTPPRRSANVAKVAEAIEAERQKADDDAARELLETAVKDAARELLEAAVKEAVAEAPVTAQPAVALSGSQRQGIIEAVSRNWNKSIVVGKVNYERLIITLAVSVAPNGMIVGDVEPITPSNPTGDFEVAYAAARRAVLRAGVIPLPAGAYPEGVRLILKFDPAFDTIGLN